MTVAVSRVNRSGQTTLPKEIREILCVSVGQEIAYLSDGKRVEVVAVPEDPLALGSEEEFRAMIARSDEQASAGRVSEKGDATARIRAKHGL